jgi:hypothetical protein
MQAYIKTAQFFVDMWPQFKPVLNFMKDFSRIMWARLYMNWDIHIRVEVVISP